MGGADTESFLKKCEELHKPTTTEEAHSDSFTCTGDFGTLLIAWSGASFLVWKLGLWFGGLEAGGGSWTAGVGASRADQPVYVHSQETQQSCPEITNSL